MKQKQKRARPNQKSKTNARARLERRRQRQEDARKKAAAIRALQQNRNATRFEDLPPELQELIRQQHAQETKAVGESLETDPSDWEEVEDVNVVEVSNQTLDAAKANATALQEELNNG